jgi:HK97 family phage portal protein
MSVLSRIKASITGTPPPKPEQLPIAYTVDSRGNLKAVKSISSPLFGELVNAYSNVPITSSPEGYAYASIVSVWAARCVEIRAASLNRLDWFVQDKQTKKRLDDHPLTYAMQWGKSRPIRKHEWSKLIWGETFFYPTKNDYGYYREIQWLNNLSVDVDTTQGYISQYMYTPTYGGRLKLLTPDQVVFFKTDNPFDDLRGLSRFETCLLEVGLDKDITRVTKSWYDNDARPGLLLLPERDLSKDEGQRLIDLWKKNFGGPKNAGKPAISPKVIKEVKEIQKAPSIDDVELRESVRREICAAFGVPLSIAGAWDDAQYQSAPEQRRSLYEETIIPEAEEMARDWTQDILPYFDEGNQNEVAFDATAIMALTENALEKIQVANSKLTSGGISLNEYREEIGQKPLENGNVFYIPTSVVQVTADKIGEMQPAQTYPPFGSTIAPPFEAAQLERGITPNPEPARLTQPETPKALPAPQENSEKELRAWEKKALNRGASKAQKFQTYTLPQDVERYVRAQLTPDLDYASIRTVFTMAQRMLKKKPVDEPEAAIPEQYDQYWQRYDQLLEAIGNAWITDYMAQAWNQIEAQVGEHYDEEQLDSALSANRQGLVDEWVGTPEKPGTLAKLVLAGMAAGSEALQRDIPNPNKAAPVEVDWSLLDKQAYDFVQSYVFNLIKRLDDTTREQVRKTFAAWMSSGQPLSALKKELEKLFHDAARAENIAQTETTRAYAEGAFNRWEQAGVTEGIWQTVRDQLVCEICGPLHGVVGNFREGWRHPRTGKLYKPPAHPRCRCFARPKV